MRVEAEDGAVAQLRRTVFDDTNAEVAIFNRSREVAVLERRPHRGVLARRNPATEHQRLGSPAHPRTQRSHEDVIRTRLAQLFWPDLAHAGLAQPEGERVTPHRHHPTKAPK